MKWLRFCEANQNMFNILAQNGLMMIINCFIRKKTSMAKVRLLSLDYF